MVLLIKIYVADNCAHELSFNFKQYKDANVANFCVLWENSVTIDLSLFITEQQDAFCFD